MTIATAGPVLRREVDLVDSAATVEEDVGLVVEVVRVEEPVAELVAARELLDAVLPWTSIVKTCA